MSAKKWAYYFSKFTLLDELLGIVYWALSIYGIFLIIESGYSDIAVILILCVYIIVVVILYIFLIKKIKRYFKGDPE
jgi:energy-converting hydrogenase Eha subunit C